MTPEEKVAEITAIWQSKTELLTPARQFDSAAVHRLSRRYRSFARPSDRQGVGSPFKPHIWTARQTVELTNAIQRYAVQNTRLGIPRAVS